MKKFIAGMLSGVIACLLVVALIASALPAYGAVTSLIGQKVAGQKVVKLNGETVGTAIIVDNKSYLPVRDTAEAFDATVTPTSEVISLTTTNPEAVVAELDTLRTNKAYYEKQIAKLQNSIKNLEEVLIPKAQKEVEEEQDDFIKQRNQKIVDSYKASLADQKQQLADLQAQLTQINARIAELEG